jgi:hypothetical protein
LAALAAGFLIAFGPFVAITGRVTNKPTGLQLLGYPVAETTYFGQAPVSTPLAVWWQDSADPGRNKLVWAARALVSETASSARQVGFAFAVLGLFSWRRRVRNGPGGAVLMVVAALHAALLIRMTSRIGYLSERHTAIIVLTGCYPAGLAVVTMAERLSTMAIAGRRMAVGTILTIIVAATAVTAWPSVRKPLHQNRAGHKAAGQWLAAHAPAASGICDPFCWAHYYAGRVFSEVADRDPDEQFVIVETSDNQHSRLPLMPEARAKAAVGQLVYHWPERLEPERAQVHVFRWIR